MLQSAADGCADVGDVCQVLDVVSVHGGMIIALMNNSINIEKIPAKIMVYDWN